MNGDRDGTTADYAAHDARQALGNVHLLRESLELLARAIETINTLTTTPTGPGYRTVRDSVAKARNLLGKMSA